MKHGLLMVSALALLAGCEKANKPGEKSELRLVGAGVDPKVKLRYAVEKGTQTTVDMVVNMRMSMMGQSPELPGMKMVLDGTCTDVDAKGRMRFEVKVASLDVEANSAQAQQAAAMMKDAMGDMVYTFRVTPLGQVDDVKISGLSGPMAQLGESMKGAMEQFAAPLPEEPVGVGSTWEVKKTGVANGMKMTTLAQSEVLEIKGDVVTVKVSGVVNAPPQTIKQGGVSAKVTKVDGRISGTIANDLKKLAPSGTFEMDLNMSMEAMGQSITMSMTMDTTMTAR